MNLKPDHYNLAVQINEEELLLLLRSADRLEAIFPDDSEELRRLATKLVNPACPINALIMAPRDYSRCGSIAHRIGNFVPVSMLGNYKPVENAFAVELHGYLTRESHYAS